MLEKCASFVGKLRKNREELDAGEQNRRCCKATSGRENWRKEVGARQDWYGGHLWQLRGVIVDQNSTECLMVFMWW
jgi:hypothetical protein